VEVGLFNLLVVVTALIDEVFLNVELFPMLASGEFLSLAPEAERDLCKGKNNHVGISLITCPP
jgi:hypothetical protein